MLGWTRGTIGKTLGIVYDPNRADNHDMLLWSYTKDQLDKPLEGYGFRKKVYNPDTDVYACILLASEYNHEGTYHFVIEEYASSYTAHIPVTWNLYSSVDELPIEYQEVAKTMMDLGGEHIRDWATGHYAFNQ